MNLLLLRRGTDVIWEDTWLLWFLDMVSIYGCMIGERGRNLCSVVKALQSA
jgi:hypothetical protein